MPRRLTVVGLLLAGLALPGSAHSAVLGSLTQLPGPQGCVQSGSPQRCAPARALGGAGSVTVSRDDAYVYAVSFEGIAVFARDRTRGALSQLAGSAGCITDDRENRNLDCAVSRGTFFAEGSTVRLSPDGRNAYAANGGGIAIFTRDPATGVLSQLPGPAGCIIRVRSSTCAQARGIDFVEHLAVSPDGRSVYTAAYNSGAIAVFSRDPATGALTQLPGRAGCVSVRRDEGCARGRALYGAEQIAVSRDGRNLYVAGWEGATAFARSSTTGALRQLPGSSGCISRRVRGCAHVRGIGQEPSSVTISPDQRHLYVGSTTCGGPPVGICLGSISVFRRDRRSGALSRLRGRAGCVSQRTGQSCGEARSLAFTYQIAISGDGRSAYAVGGTNIAVFSRARRTGALRQLRGALGVVRGRGLSDSRSVAISADGRSVYAASEDRDAVAIFARQPGVLAR
jgi:6-phosphogluconolactonase (cycloisomerase 2 family)